MSVSRAEVVVSVLVYGASLLLAGLSNVWLSVWGRRLSVLNSYFRSHQPLLDDDDRASVRIDPFDLAALEASMSSAAAGRGEQQCDGSGVCGGGPISPSPMFDLGLHFLPHLHCRWLPDAFVFVLLPLLMAAVLAPTAARHRSRPGSATAGGGSDTVWPASAAIRLCCVLQSHSVMLLMRSTTTLATVHRASPVCHALSLESSSQPGFVLNNGCFDLMFSGHTAFVVMSAFFISLRPELGWPGQALIAVLAACGSVANVVVGDHFTADCLVAAHIAILVCCLFRHRFQHTLRAASTDELLRQQSDTAQRASMAAVSHTGRTNSRSNDTQRSVSPPSEAASDGAQRMDVDVQHSAHHTRGGLDDGMDVESSEGESEQQRGPGLLPSSERRQWREEKVDTELQQLINRWQLADSHGLTAIAARRHTRRHTDIG